MHFVFRIISLLNQFVNAVQMVLYDLMLFFSQTRKRRSLFTLITDKWFSDEGLSSSQKV